MRLPPFSVPFVPKNRVNTPWIADRKWSHLSHIWQLAIGVSRELSRVFLGGGHVKRGIMIAVLFIQSLFGAVIPYTAQNYSHLIGMPGFSDSLLQIHFKLYEGYVKNANDLIAKLKAMNDAGQAGSYEYGSLKRRLGWEFDGMRLHELYFGNLGGSGNLDPSSPLFAAIVDQFGSYDNWKKDFIATGLIRGIGWAALYLDPLQGRLTNAWINEHDVGHFAGGAPILLMDVFEHAYMPQYGLDRAKYIDAFFRNIDWKASESRYTRSTSMEQ